jgi:hypothetical protein
MIHVPPSTLVVTSTPVRKPGIIRRVFAALFRHQGPLLQVWQVSMVVLITFAAAIPLKVHLSRTAGARFDPALQVSPAGLRHAADMRATATTQTNGMTFEFIDPIVPADSIPNTDRGAGWGPLRLTDW